MEGVSAVVDGQPVAVEKSRKNRWRVTTGGAPSVTVRYRVYSREEVVLDTIQRAYGEEYAANSAATPRWIPRSRR